jgi:hypothetical protein
LTHLQVSGTTDVVKRNVTQEALVTAVVRGAIAVGGIASLLSGLPASAQTAQNVTLIWDANTEAGITGYRLHYGTASGNYSQSAEVGTATSTTVSDLTVGQTYYFVVTDYNAAGLESLPSNEVAYTAVAQPSPPTVSLAVTPAAGTRFVVPVNIVLTASASEAGGSIVRVEFYNGNTYLGEVTAPPYTFTLNQPAPGNYSLTARAFDDQGISTTSTAIEVTVTSPPLPRITR